MTTLLAALLLAQIELPLDLDQLRSLAAQVRQGTLSNPRQQLLDAASRARERHDAMSAAYAQAGLAALAEVAGRGQAAESTWREAASAEVLQREPAFTGRTAWWIAEELAQAGRLVRSRRWCDLAVEQARAAGDRRTEALALQLSARQMPVAARRGLLAQASAAAQATGDALLIANLQVDWGEVLRAGGDLAGAIAELRSASATLRRLGAHVPAGKALTALARALGVHGRFPEALAELEAAEALLARSADASLLLRTRLEMANVLAGLRQPARALALLRRAEPGVPAGDRALGTLLAHGYLAAGDARKAAEVASPLVRGVLRRASAVHWILSAACVRLGRYDEAIEAASAALTPAASGTLIQIQALRWRGRALDRLGRQEEAAADMRQVAALGEDVLRKAAPEDEMRLAFTDRLEEIADDVIAVLWRAGHQREALETAERFRARAFLDLVAGRSGEQAGAWFVPLDHVVEQARASRQSVLAYWSHPECLYAWLVTPSGEVLSRQTPVTEARLAALVEQARRFDHKPDRTAWRELHRLLVRPFGGALPAGAAVTILPHGPLLRLPFAALLAPSGRYLLEDVRLRVIPTVALLMRTPGAAATGPALLAGVPVRTGLPALPGTQRELAAVQASLAGDRQVFTGARLLSTSIAQAAPAARVLHFATHAVIDEREPLASYLALSERERLTTEAVYRWRLQADLVVLSACRGGAGRVAADGLLGFPRAFLYAGAASVIAPLADIPDETTVRLMAEFYRRYGRGEPKASALRAAQLRLLGDLRAGRVTVTTPAGSLVLTEHPALWATFVLMGQE